MGFWKKNTNETMLLSKGLGSTKTCLSGFEAAIPIGSVGMVDFDPTRSYYKIKGQLGFFRPYTGFCKWFLGGPP